ncbi:MAG: T9SS type A sorting domain-containing protein [bacterium]
MKRILILTFILLVAVTACLGYNRRSMYELFTSGTCGPCVSANTYLDDWYPLHTDEVCLIRYHTSWPGTGDIFYAANPTQNSGRTSFYSVSGVPSAVINGSVLGSWVGSGDVAVGAAGGYTPLEIEIIPLDSGNVRISVICEDPTYSATLNMYVALIEDSITYTAPNGQTHFDEVMRYMLPDHNGQMIAINGDTTITQHFDFTPHLGNVWDYHHCTYVVWLQDRTGSVKEIHQCNNAHVDDMSEYGHIIDHGLLTQMIQPRDTSEFSFELLNFGYMTDDFNVWMESETPGGWFVQLDVEGTVGDSTTVDLLSLETLEGTLKISPLGDPKTGHVKVFFSPTDDPDGGVDTLRFSVLAGGDLLYVVSSAAVENIDYYLDLFEDNDVSYGLWNQGINGHLPDYSNMRYDAVLWHDEYNTIDGMNEVERPALRDYLNNGGKVFITSSGLGTALGSLPAFYMFVLGAQYQGTEYNPTTATGSGFTGTEFTHLNLTLPGSGYSADKFTLYGGVSEGILRYGSGATCGLKKDFDGGGKLVYIGFDLSAVSNETQRDDFWDALLVYWGGLGVADAKLPRKEALISAMPNPFNSTATIEVELPQNGHVAIEVFDVTGRKVEEIHNGMLSAGVNSVRWNAEKQSSGIYWIRITGDYSAQTKALLLK